ncbi:molybdate ABC transporter substrate-binding protein [Sinomonas sp. ASV322]|uniref:molybdate ABC transporter substrate-binding protein n=1 Tax=Sinomonas sp. ASV322 TaxID=3041920 RepID=UPI0027DE3386|nr:molybdate ABC transporter substrate-binding protein [Sinomonas sp. ASV322]MDQ4502852.1 molybdate ABC transporter substrate-binding protein [Sinomonas sp. ASV322]
MTRPRRIWSLLAVAAAVLAFLLTACGEIPASGGAASSFAARGVTLRVFAAASLKATFTQLAQEFEDDHPGTTVSINVGGSSDLVSQLQNGAPADVFASADEATMAKATNAGLVNGTPQVFATNVLELAVPKGNATGIHSLQDLSRPGVRLVVCAKQVPCGAAAQKAAQAAGVTLKPVSEEQSVTDVLAKVMSGDADAGLLYMTDVKSTAGKVDGVPFPQATAAVNRYPIAALKQSKEAALAQAFVDFIGGDSGRKVLGDAGFGAP